MATIERPKYLRRKALQLRWGNMSDSTFFHRVKNGRIPPAVYPFGPDIPYWRVDEIEALEAKAEAAATAGNVSGMGKVTAALRARKTNAATA